MDNKRVLLAVALSFLVLVGYQYLFPQQPEQPAPAVEQSAPAAAAEKVAPLPAPDGGVDPVQSISALPASGETVTVETPLYVAKINSSGGVLESFKLKKYRQTIDPDSPMVDIMEGNAASKAPLGLLLNGIPTWTKGEWQVSEKGHVTVEQEHTLVFSAVVSGYKIERHLTFLPDTYLITEQVSVTNTGTTSSLGRVAFTAAAQQFTKEDDRYNPTRVDYYGNEERVEFDDREELTAGKQVSADIDWAAINSHYFLFALLPMSDQSTLKARIQDDIFRIAFEETRTFEPGKSVDLNAGYYVGPADRELLNQAPSNLGEVVNFGYFTIIAKPLLYILNLFYTKVCANYGVAIILLTVLLKIIFWPLSQKSYRSMKQMQKLQPMTVKLREKYGDDKERLQRETMQLYKTYKVNPASGCVPMLVQIPVFFGLYRALLGAIELRHAPFITHLPFTDIIWLADLSAKDPFYITPVVMGLTTFLQQKLTPQAGDPTQAKIMMFMPVMFTFIFLNFPAGLVVYWLANNVLSIAQQTMALKTMK
jgi:YidC/Oxa1 family membrane protein insertase